MKVLLVKLCLICAALIAFSAHAQAGVYVLDFEGGFQSTGGGWYQTLDYKFKNDGTATFKISRQSFSKFDLFAVNIVPRQTGVFGTNSLFPFPYTEGNGFIVSFPFAATSVSVDMGDWQDDTDTLSLKAYAGDGTLLGQDTQTLSPNGGLFSYRTLQVNASGIRSVIVIGGSAQEPNSVYYDNIRVTVP